MKVGTKIILGLFVAVLIVALVFVYKYFQKPEPTPIVVPKSEYRVIGRSVNNREIQAYQFGQGDRHLVFVGGVHGGYEWNSVILAYQFIDYFKVNSSLIPASTTVTIIPALNPDGVYKVIGKEGRFTVLDIPTGTDESVGRFNANGVDLNRNFACDWQPESMWRGNKVSAGTQAFSEPESVALRDFLLITKPVGVVFWHSQSNAVYASQCGQGILPETRRLMNTYAGASGYPAVDVFDAYTITGDMADWLSTINIPAVTVELKTHETIEWEKNLAGVKALLNQY